MVVLSNQMLLECNQLMIQLYRQQYLTMSQTFKIRKNKSQKDINFNRRSPLLGTHQLPKQKGPNHHCQSKMLQLQPLLTTKGSIGKPNDKLQEYKLDFTQPVPPKSHSLTNQESKSEAFHLMPIEANPAVKHQINDKQNRPPNQHEVKYPAIGKINSTMLKTDKNGSMARLAHLTEGLHNFRSEKDLEAEACKKTSLAQKKMNLLKTSSRTKLAKIFGAKPFNQQNQIPNEMQLDERAEFGPNSAYKQQIIYKSTAHHKNPTSERAISQQKVSQTEKHTTLQEKKQNKLEQPYASPPHTKNTNEHWGNCSTIRQLKEQEESCSSFITGQAIQDFMFPKQAFEPIAFLEEKLHVDRRIKVQTDRIKKKFPQNFFK